MAGAGRRWDSDERRRGVADARTMAPYVDQLRELVFESDWVTEDPEAHLLPHVERAIGAEADTKVTGSRVTEDGVLEVVLEVPPGTSARRAREVAYGVVASIGEAVTFVRQTKNGDAATFEVVTGEVVTGEVGGESPSDASTFATHGHRVTIQVRSKAER